MKNIAWWGGIIIAAGAAVWALYQGGGELTLIACVVFAGLAYVTIRAYVYRIRFKNFVKGTAYIHQLIHRLRDHFGEINGLTQNRERNNPPVVGVSVPTDDIRPLLAYVLDSAAHCFREMTGKRCTSSLIMPGRSIELGDYLQSVMYCSDTDSERVKGVRPQKQGLVHEAFLASSPAKLYEDYEAEMRKGQYVVSRPDGLKWARSGYMAHFKVGGVPFGILNIDSPEPRTFRRDHEQILCAFADCCGLILSLANTNDEYESVQTENNPQDGQQ